jgi:hypothetical protein
MKFFFFFFFLHPKFYHFFLFFLFFAILFSSFNLFIWQYQAGKGVGEAYAWPGDTGQLVQKDAGLRGVLRRE